jgi:DNA-binding beta-propeller fold protein YncE
MEMLRMFNERANSIKVAQALTVIVLLLAVGFAPASFAKSRKHKEPAAAPTPAPVKPQIDLTKLVWPAPPNIPRVRYVDYFAGEKIPVLPEGTKPKQKRSWMDRLAGLEPENRRVVKPLPFQLLGPYGMAVDSQGRLYVADQRVGAIFIFNTENRDDVTLIRNGFEATFGLINAVAIDDDDRIFVTDGKLHRVLIFDKNRKVVDQIKDGLVDPVGIAIDTENRLVYVVDTQQDQVLVYDADKLNLIRRIGTGGKKHTLTTPGDFSAPTDVALDKDGNVYVTDTMNYRVEIFDADGHYISQFGRHCDGPGCFAHPKGLAVDSDGHIWVADPMLDLLQIFNRQGQLLAVIGGHGNYLGEFSSLVGVTVDKNNRVFTSEQYPGRVQEFRYITDAEADQLRKEKEATREKPAPSSQTAEAKPETKH